MKKLYKGHICDVIHIHNDTAWIHVEGGSYSFVPTIELVEPLTKNEVLVADIIDKHIISANLVDEYVNSGASSLTLARDILELNIPREYNPAFKDLQAFFNDSL